MLTVDITTLLAEVPTDVYAIEYDLEYGTLKTFGATDVAYYPTTGRGEATLESGNTGGCYTEPQDISDVQIWTSEHGVFAVFADEASMRDGGRQLAAHWGDQLPVGIHRRLA